MATAGGSESTIRARHRLSGPLRRTEEVRKSIPDAPAARFTAIPNEVLNSCFDGARRSEAVSVKFEYEIRSRIEVEDGAWAPIAFERGQTHFKVAKPTTKSDCYVQFADSGLVNGALLVDLTVLSIQADSPDSIPEDNFVLPFVERIEAIRNELVTWIRAVTKQYWVRIPGKRLPQRANKGHGSLGRPRHFRGRRVGERIQVR